MNLEGEKFSELLELYPDTAENLKLRALEKRSIFMYYKEKATMRAALSKQKSRKLLQNKLGAQEGKDKEYTLKESRDPVLYTSTYKKLNKNDPQDSDRDPCHITMPFRQSDAIRKQIFEEPVFETDEEYEVEPEEQDKENASKLKTQNDILETMQKTITKISEAIASNQQSTPMAKTLKKSLKTNHDTIEGLDADYEYVKEEEEEI